MKRIIWNIWVAATFSAALLAQAPTKSTAPARAATPARSGSAASSAVKLPPGVPPARGVIKTAFSLRYQDVKIGTGKEAEPNKLYKVHYTGWLASTGTKFDSSFDHRMPAVGADGKAEMGPDGKPKFGEPQPISIPQGFGRVIPGFDQGFAGMKIGGKRRLFIPWQLAYGVRGRPGIPPKSDLIFDVELVDVSDLQMPANHPTAGAPLPGGHPVPNPQGARGAAPTAPTGPAGTGSNGPGVPPASGAPAQPANPSAVPPAPTEKPQI